ncbi:protein sidekick-2-like [Actinia tenebrosa]|uniref:Protein sidekick-2-like n=1 Tax=Actinia tenebrosa TaxID=6105 RepID=A0A6P8IQF3_ACTTE|nr:protein sidekick-2-like [Actinia tenebrosa]
MKVTWSSIPYNDRNGVILGYKIEFFDMYFGYLVENVTVPSIVREKEYHNLSIYNLYGVQVKGFTIIGDGPRNDLSETVARTEESVPIVAPSHLVGYNLSVHSILVQWYFDSNERNVLGVLLGFRIFLNGADNEPNFHPSTRDVKNDTNMIHFGGLWPYTVYNLSIAAYTRKGHGVISQPFLVKTDGKAPGLPPFPVKAHNTSSTSIQVSWREVDKHYHHGVLLGYKVIVRELLQSAVTINKTVPKGTNVTDINGLKIYTTYVIKVLAFNKYGEGEYDEEFATTDEDIPSRPPTLVTAWNTSSTSIQVSWQPLNDSYYEHGVLLGYQLTYHRTDERGDVENLVFCPDELTTNITELDKYVKYTITVRVFNSKGFGPVSPPVFCTTDEDVPDLGPLNLQGFNTSKSSIFVKWDPVPADERNGVLLGYNIMYNITNLAPSQSSRRKRRSVSSATFTALVQPGQENYTIYGLFPYTLYSIGIAGYTRIGVGHWSPAIYIRTNDEEPQIPPPDVMVFNTSSTSINVTWLAIPPPLVAGILTSYLIKYTELDDEGKNVTSLLKIVPATQLTIELTGLEKYTDYNITVRGATVEIGVESSPVMVRTHEDTPSKPPQNMTVVQTSYSTLNVSWKAIPKPFIHGILRGYIMFYKKTIDFWTGINHTMKFLPNMTSYQLTDLEPYTNYSVWMFGFTSVGNGTATTVKYAVTDEYVPSKSPVNVTAMNFTSHRSINVSWHPIPHGFVHGILRGYRVLYKKVMMQDEEWSGIQVNYTVQSQSLSTMIEDLDNYAVYQIQVLGFTIKGDGVISQSVYAETCRCSKELTTSWYMMEPYVTHNQSTTSGLIPRILEPLVTWCCGNCYNGHGQTDINLIHDGQGNNAQKSNATQVLVPNTDLMFPVYGFYGKTTHEDYGYLSVVTSPGISFITLTQEMTSVMFKSTSESWPLFVMMLVMVLLAGVLTWLLDSNQNPEHFPRPFIKGSYEGCWLAFISITTVGYGDRAPKSFWARILTLVNMLSGFILISLITANLSSDFVVTTIMASKKTLYMTKVGAITRSFEYSIAVRRNALVNTESEYYSYKDLNDALISEEIQGILVDTYIATSHPELFSASQFGGPPITRQLLPYESVYGVALERKTDKLRKCFNNYLKFNKDEISRIIEGNLKQPGVSEESAAEEMSSMIFDPSSKYFQYLYKYIGLALIGAVMSGLTYALLLRRKHSVQPRAQELQRIQRIQEARAMINDFYEAFSSSYREMKRRHREERLRCLKKTIESRTKDTCQEKNS